MPPRLRLDIGIGAATPPSPSDAISSAHSKRTYEKALKDFLAWCSAEARPPLSRAIVQQFRSVQQSASLAPASADLRLSAIRKLPVREQARHLLAQPQIETTEGKGTAQFWRCFWAAPWRRSELAALKCAHIQLRDGRWGPGGQGRKTFPTH